MILFIMSYFTKKKTPHHFPAKVGSTPSLPPSVYTPAKKFLVLDSRKLESIYHLK